jgi:hypothetical protein
MDFPEDIGQRIVEATRLAVMLHIQHSLQMESFPGGTGRRAGDAGLPIGGVDFFGGAAMDGGDITPRSVRTARAGTLARGGASAAESEAA